MIYIIICRYNILFTPCSIDTHVLLFRTIYPRLKYKCYEIRILYENLYCIYTLVYTCTNILVYNNFTVNIIYQTTTDKLISFSLDITLKKKNNKLLEIPQENANAV